MSGLLSRLLKKSRKPQKLSEVKPSGVVNIDGTPIHDITFLGVSRLGNLSWTGKIDGQPVKIFEAFHPEHANTVAEIMGLPDLRDIFPRVYFRKDQYIVAEWVEGTPLDTVITKDPIHYYRGMVELQRRIHGSQSTLVQPFCYNYFEYIIERHKRFAGPFAHDNTDFLAHHSAAALYPEEECRFFHLDCTPKNIVLHKDGMKIIDNELLGYGIFYPFDFFNTYQSLHRYPRADEYLRLIKQSEPESLGLIQKHKAFFLNMWNLRMVGYAIQSNKPFSKLLRQGGQPLNHPIFDSLDKNEA